MSQPAMESVFIVRRRMTSWLVNKILPLYFLFIYRRILHISIENAFRPCS